jgi:hypothetical protein
LELELQFLLNFSHEWELEWESPWFLDQLLISEDGYTHHLHVHPTNNKYRFYY